MRARLAGMLALVLAALLPGGGAQASDPPAPRDLFRSARSWEFQLQHIDLERISASSADLLVIDISRDATPGGNFTPVEIERLKRRTDGRRRLVLAYFSIGEAEDHREYWLPSWSLKRPDWMLEENCRWPANHLVKYWSAPWKDLLFRRPDSYLAQILAAGFGGVYLDRVDAYWDLRKSYPGGRAEMIRLVGEIRARARAARPEFLMIAQNAEGLLSDRAYRAMIDGIAKEDLLYGVTETGRRNEASLIRWSLSQLRRLRAAGKPVLVVEYLRSGPAIDAAARELRALGFTATFQTRLLDGRDPRDPSAHDEMGTPEFRKARCR